jgi:sulfate transport system substrate-binding protein
MNVLRQRRGRSIRTATVLTVVAATALGLSACGSSSGGSAGSGDSKQLNLVGFAVIKSAYDDLGAAFAKTDAGKGVTIQGSFGASGAQSRAVIAGQKADVVALSLSPDVKKIAEAGKIATGWDGGANKGIVSDSVVVIAFREGNPKGIKGWADIIKPGVGIVTADPGTSGSAKWNLLAAYSQALGANKDEAAAKAYLGSFVKNVVSWNDSGRTATDAFVKGTGDVLISYENEAIAARAAGVKLEYVVPDSTFLIENPAAVTTTAPPAATEFLKYIQSTDGQKIFASKGFRPIDPSVTATDVPGANDPANPFPKVTNLTTVADLGGWSTVNDSLFDPDKGLVAELRK